MGESEEKKLETLVYWGRCVMGAVVGAILAAFWRANLGGLLTAASVAIIAYVALSYLLRFMLGEHRVQLLGGGSKLNMIGVGIFFLSALFFWAFLYSFFFYVS